MEATFLTDQQIWGDDRGNGQLQAMKSYGTKTGMSDLAIVLGGYMGSDTTSDNQRSGYVWSASSDGGGSVRDVHVVGVRDDGGPRERLLGARPALPSSVTSSIKPSEARLTQKISGVDVVEYGEYPQTIAADNVSRELEQVFSRNQLKATGKKYTFDGEKYDAYSKPFKAKEYAEYEHRGKRYIRVEAQPYDSDSVLSNGKTPQKGEACWIEVQPIKWLKDTSGVWVARQALFAGVQFDRKQSYDGNFENTDIKKYLQNHFAKEMVAGRSVNTNAPAVVGASTAAVAARRDTQRQRALEDPSQGL
ncbi:MAG: hypothetical protein SFX19_05425 [Alphaproteobacteria bacterium]|nr:hypothetical protein [Alphaproteobacteria bacterium]